jgi:hypothetical protein
MAELSVDKMGVHIDRIIKEKVRFDRPKYTGNVVYAHLTRKQIDDLIIAAYVAGWADGVQERENAGVDDATD